MNPTGSDGELLQYSPAQADQLAPGAAVGAG
jgi:hypothetical protein